MFMSTSPNVSGATLVTKAASGGAVSNLGRTSKQSGGRVDLEAQVGIKLILVCFALHQALELCQHV